MEKYKHHFTPQFILRNFSIERMIGVKVKSNKDYHIRSLDKIDERIDGKSQIELVAQDRLFYGADLVVEDFLGLKENYAAPIFAKIIKSGIIDSISESDREIVADFIVIQNKRTRLIRTMIDDINRDVKEDLLKKNVISAFKNEMTVQNERITQREPEKIEQLKHLSWQIIAAPPDFLFCTADHPLFIFNKRDNQAIAFHAAGFQLYFPLSPRYCLRLIDPTSASFLQQKTKRAKAMFIDHGILTNCERYVYSPSLQVLNHLRAYVHDHPAIKNPTRYTVNYGSVKTEPADHETIVMYYRNKETGKVIPANRNMKCWNSIDRAKYDEFILEDKEHKKFRFIRYDAVGYPYEYDSYPIRGSTEEEIKSEFQDMLKTYDFDKARRKST